MSLSHSCNSIAERVGGSLVPFEFCPLNSNRIAERVGRSLRPFKPEAAVRGAGTFLHCIGGYPKGCKELLCSSAILYESLRRDSKGLSIYSSYSIMDLRGVGECVGAPLFLRKNACDLFKYPPHYKYRQEQRFPSLGSSSVPPPEPYTRVFSCTKIHLRRSLMKKWRACFKNTFYSLRR